MMVVKEDNKLIIRLDVEQATQTSRKVWKGKRKRDKTEFRKKFCVNHLELNYIDKSKIVAID